MALLPLEGPAPVVGDARVQGEVKASAFATEEAFLHACTVEADRIGRCVPHPRVVTYQWDRARDVMLILVERQPDAL